jgi:hypothetical protein
MQHGLARPNTAAVNSSDTAAIIISYQAYKAIFLQLAPQQRKSGSAIAANAHVIRQ